MSYRIEEQVRIDAPRQLVWDIIQNPARRIEWDGSLQNLKKLVEAEYRVQVRQAVPVLA